MRELKAGSLGLPGEGVSTKMSMRDLESLFGRILVVVAHQDDETACAALLQRARGAQVVYATDGAPAAEFFWGRYGSRQQYAAVRRAEARESLAVIGIAAPIFLEDADKRTAFQDQDLYRHLAPALEALDEVACRFKPDALLAPAYEGGHPDHDACSFLVNVLGQRRSILRWEMPLYHRSQSGTLVLQEFQTPLGKEAVFHPSCSELRRRDEMLSKYLSQPDASKFVSSGVERFRPQPDYDYSQPPSRWALNYEVWGWPMTGSELCTAFQSCKASDFRSHCEIRGLRGRWY